MSMLGTILVSVTHALEARLMSVTCDVAKSHGGVPGSYYSRELS